MDGKILDLIGEVSKDLGLELITSPTLFFF